MPNAWQDSDILGLIQFVYIRIRVVRKMAGQGFFKGEKKKQKKDKQKPSIGVTSSKPIFTLPEVISKKDKAY